MTNEETVIGDDVVVVMETYPALGEQETEPVVEAHEEPED